jgi:hypothetical protein
VSDLVIRGIQGDCQRPAAEKPAQFAVGCPP